MARRSLNASLEGIATLKATLKRKKWAQTFLAGAVGCSRQTVWSLLHGNPIDADVFLEICTQLGLSEHEIAEASQAEERSGEILEIDELVRQVRAQIKPWIHERCGWMNVLSMTRPIGLGDIYTNVNILEKITGRKRLALEELEANCLEEDFDHFGFSYLRKKDDPIPGLDAVEQCKKMLVLGKPGAGKTTFLKRIATQCNLGTFHPGLVPTFVPLKQFAETKGQPMLLDYIVNQWAECKVKDSDSKAETLLYEGRALVLLDGLDEVIKEDSSRVIEDIRQFSERFYKNLYVLTCRIATHEFKLEPFTEVEIADFDDQQIAVFVTKWFELKNPARTESFLRKLKESPRIRELATNPLLLTLMCLGFEESAYFSDSRAALYKDGLNVLLKSWNATKPGIEHEQIYRQLIPDRKEDLLSQLAYQTFEQGQYFFSEEIAKQNISRYIANLPSVDSHAEQLYIDSEAVLKSIEGQHGLLIPRSQGIYSFSHLTFQEYYTARKIAASCNAYSSEDETLQNLAQRVTEKRWREVFLLLAEILPSADNLLQCMKKQIDSSIPKDNPLQQFLGWAQQKTCSVNAPYNSAAVRAFYMSLTLKRLAHNHTINLIRALDLKLNLDLDRVRVRASNPNLDLDFTPELTRIDLELDQFLSQALRRSDDCFATLNSPDLAQPYAQTLSQSLNCAQTCALDPKFNNTLKGLKAQLPNTEENFSVFIEWWKTQGQIWVDTFRAAMKEYRNIPDLPFTYPKNKLLEYLEANLLLVDCLNSSCYISRSVREEIEDTLLLPIAEIERRKLAKLSETPSPS
jgi:predicted NACHT family NTPase